MKYNQLTDVTFSRALKELGDGDPDFTAILNAIGPPPMWAREPGFPTLIQIILEQQVSLASAKAAFDRLNEAVTVLSPDEFLKLDDVGLKQIGFSRQKSRYCRILAEAVRDASLPLDQLADMSDDEVSVELIKITGIGQWTANIYLLMALKRPDVWPVGDIALYAALQKVKRLPSRPDAEKFVELGEQWRPWRAVAARILWHYYLSGMK